MGAKALRTWALETSFVLVAPLEAIEQEKKSFNAQKTWESPSLFHR